MYNNRLYYYKHSDYVLFMMGGMKESGRGNRIWDLKERGTEASRLVARANVGRLVPYAC